MDEAAQAQFMSITGASPTTAIQYLEFAESNLEAAIELFYANDGASLDQPTATPQAPPIPPPSTRPPGHTSTYEEDRDGVVHIDSDDDVRGFSDDDEVRVRGSNQRPSVGSTRTAAALRTPPVATPPPGVGVTGVDDDEAMARRLQEEFYGASGTGASNGRSEDVDEFGYRAPIQRTTETLIGPASFDPSDPDEMRAAVMQQMAARRQPRQNRDRPGIFNQATTSIWNDAQGMPHDGRNHLAMATGGASEASAKHNTLAEMYRPPFEIMARLPWDDAREQGKENQKWILVNIQDNSIFDCQLLNRDIWKNPSIMETVKENFIFMQYAKDDQRGNSYTQYYFENKDVESAYPHIAIVDPRTGEQVKKWSGPPAPKAPDFLMQLHEFLDRYSLHAMAKNPIAKRKPEPKQETQVDRMTEEQQLEMAMKASLAGAAEAKDDDPDELTRSFDQSKDKGKGVGADEATSEVQERLRVNGKSQTTPSTFASISSTSQHIEPKPAEPDTTRIQFRHPNGRVVRRFALSDAVRRIYEWLKATPLEGQEGKDFELVFMQKNLIQSLDESIEQAGLKNGTVMVEIIEGEG